MTRFRAGLILLSVYFAAAPAAVQAGSQKPEASSPPGVDPLPIVEPVMTEDQLEAYFAPLKKGTPVQLTLTKGEPVKGLYSSYDDYYQTVWIIPRGTEKGAFNQKGYKLAGIRSVKPWDRKTPVPVQTSTEPSSEAATLQEMAGDDYYLLKQNGK